jgi:glucose/arabinose dehydrogenase
MTKTISLLIGMAILVNGCAFPPPALNVEIEDTQPTAGFTPTDSEKIAVPAAINQVTAWKLETVVEGLTVPWSIVFTAPDRMLVSERGGAIREVLNGQLEPDPVFVFNDVSASGESGLMGLAIDPQYPSNGFIYACYTYSKNGQATNRIVRLTDNADSMSMDLAIMDGLASARNHAGCRIAFGPDEKLYITVGDAMDPSSAQDMSSLAGKILRINPDGSIPGDNPYASSPVWSYGHRNPQGLAWNFDNGLMYSSEHGPSGFDGPPGGDEINWIMPGENYGWPLVSHDESLEGMKDPVIQFTPAEAPASLMVYGSDVLPMFNGNFFFGALRGEGLMRFGISTSDPEKVTLVEKVIKDVGRVRDVVEGPDGYIYFSTSNRDGRGAPRDGDDHIYRIVPDNN